MNLEHLTEAEGAIVTAHRLLAARPDGEWGDMADYLLCKHLKEVPALGQVRATLAVGVKLKDVREAMAQLEALFPRVPE